jgi:hypothetical protein
MAICKLNKEYFVKGYSGDRNRFFELLDELDQNTKYIQCEEGVTLCTAEPYLDTIEYYNSISGLRAQNCNKLLFDAANMEELFNELKTEKTSLLEVNGKSYLTFPRVVPEIANAAKLRGTALNIPSKERDRYVTVLSEETPLTLVVREECGIERIVAARTGKYTPIPLATIKEIINKFLESEEIGSYLVSNWEVSQDIAQILIEFPEFEEEMKEKYPDLPSSYIPGIVIRNGQTGYSQLAVQMYYRKDNCDRPYFIHQTSAKHYAGFDLDVFMQKVKNEVWGKVYEMPAKLAEAEQVPLTENEANEFVKKILKHIGIYHVFHKKDTEESKYVESVKDAIQQWLNYNVYGRPLTAYDCIAAVMEVPDNIVLPSSYYSLLTNVTDNAWTVDLP